MTSVNTDGDVYLEHAAALIRYATALVGPDDAPDVVSTVIARAMTRGRLADLDEPRAYLFRAVLNEARNLRRSRGRQAAAVVRIGPPPSTPPADDGVHPEVVDAVMALPVRQRAAIYLVYWEGLTPSEAAREMGVRPATLRRYLLLARRKLRRFLDG